MVKMFKKLVNWLMPDDDFGDEEEVVVEEKKTEVKKSESKENQAQAQMSKETPARRMVSGGGKVISDFVPVGVMNTSVNGTTSMNGVRYKAYTDKTVTNAPDLKIVKSVNLAVRIYRPKNYDQINDIADDILSGMAAVVNYEKLKEVDRIRFCDYLDGNCYAVDGKSVKVSDKIYLYIPSGVEASDVAGVKLEAERFS